MLEAKHIDYKLNVLDHPLIPLKTAGNQALICDLTAKAKDVVWMYRHMHKKQPLSLCEGKGYQGFVFPKEAAYGRNLDYSNVVYIDLGCKDIALAEKILQIQVQQVISLRRNYSDVELDRYYRQYVGYRRENGDRVVYVDLVRKDIASVGILLNGLVRIYQGHKVNLDAKVNLTQGKVETFQTTFMDRGE